MNMIIFVIASRAFVCIGSTVTICRPIRIFHTGFFCHKSGTLQVYAYLIIVINIMSFNIKGMESNETIMRACMNKRKFID